MKQSGFSFEAGGRTFPSVVFHSMSGTLMLKVEGFFLFFVIIIIYFFLLKPLINLLPFPLHVPLPNVKFIFRI